MSSDYSKQTWVDEVLAAAARYDILEDGGGAFKSTMQINLATGVTIAGTTLTAARLNNMEDQLELDDILLREAATEKTVAAGVLTADLSRHTIQPQSGTSDDIDTISGLETDTFGFLMASDPGTDTLTFKHGVDNISCFGASDIALSQGMVIVYYDGTTVFATGGGAINATAQYKLLGRVSAGAGSFEEITGSANVFSFMGAATYAAMLALLSGQASADFSMNTNKITAVTDPTANQDAATKKYVDDNAGGAMTLIEHKDADGGAVASFDFTSIAGTYKHLVLEFTLRSDVVATGDELYMNINNDSGNNYDYLVWVSYHNAQLVTAEGLATAFIWCSSICGASSVAGDYAAGFIKLNNYANANFNKDFQTRSGLRLTSTSTNIRLYDSVSHWRSTAAITRITLTPNTGPNFEQYSAVDLYGIG